MGVVIDVFVAGLAGKGHVPQAEHVKRRDRGPGDSDPEEIAVQRIGLLEGQGLGQDAVLGVVAAQSHDQRYARSRDRQAAHEHRARRPGHLLPQAAHRRHFVGARGMDHRSGAEEQQRLEEGVREEVEHASQPTAQAQGQHHVAQLADGRIGQHAFDVSGGDGDRGGDEERDRAHDGDDQQDLGREDRVTAADEVNARGDHRGGVDQGADGRGAFHGVGQPDVQGELALFPTQPQKMPRPATMRRP